MENGLSRTMRLVFGLLQVKNPTIRTQTSTPSTKPAYFHQINPAALLIPRPRDTAHTAALCLLSRLSSAGMAENRLISRFFPEIFFQNLVTFCCIYRIYCIYLNIN